jgi:hypothetical protein
MSQFPAGIWTHHKFLLYMLHAPPISSSFIWWPYQGRLRGGHLRPSIFGTYCHVLGVVTIRRGMDLMIGFIENLCIHNSELQTITALPLICTLYSSPLHTHQCPQSTLVVSWQRVYNAYCHYSIHEVCFSQPNFFPAISSQSFDCRLQRLSQFFWQLTRCYKLPCL